MNLLGTTTVSKQRESRRQDQFAPFTRKSHDYDWGGVSYWDASNKKRNIPSPPQGDTDPTRN